MKTKAPWWKPTRSALWGGLAIGLVIAFVVQMALFLRAERIACEAKGGVLQQRTYTCLKKDVVITP